MRRSKMEEEVRSETKFKKRNRNIRKRDVQSDEESPVNEIPFLEDNYHTEILKNAREKLEKRKKKKDKLKDGEKKPSVGSGLLSFGGDEDEHSDVFQVKKSSHSKKMAKKAKDRQKELKELEKKTPKDDTPSNTTQLSSGTGQYTAEKLASLKEENIILSGKVAEAMAAEEEDKDEIAGKVRNLTSGSIPDANLIHLARKKRQMAREMGQQDFVPLDDTQTYASNDSRLIREDDNDNSDDDENERMGFSVRHKTNRERIIESIDINQFAGDNHDRDEMDLFEVEQIRKGTSTSAPQGQGPVEQTSQDAYFYPEVPYLSTNPYGEDYSALEYSDEAPAPPMALLPLDLPQVSLETLKKNIKDRFESVDEVYRSHQREEEKLTDQLESSKSNSDRLKESTKSASDQYSFFQEMRGYVSDLIECLNEKVPIINGLDLAMNVLLKQRAQQLVTRRQIDIKDQSAEFISSKAASAPNLGSGVKGKRNKDEEAIQRRTAEREARRSRRRRARQTKQEGVMHYDGMSSDDEMMESNRSKFIAERNRFIEEANALFADVTEDFKSVLSIESRFQAWKFDHSESYLDAYISLCLPKLFSPFVKLQLLSWNPLEPNNKDLEDYRWHDDMLFYGCNNVEKCDIDDPDLSLIPNIVEKFILPKLTGLVENVWDPMSTSQTHRLVTLVHKLSEDYPTVSTENKNTQELLTAVVVRMRKTLDDDVYMPLFPKSVLENKSSGAYNFLQRQFWSCVKLLGNMLNWQGIIAQDTLLDVAVDGLLNRYLLLSLQNSDINEDSVNKCLQITSTFPKEWFKDLEGDSTIRQLEPFCRYLCHAVDTCHKGSFGSSDLDRRKNKSHIKTITKLLVNIHAMNHALNITSEFSLKDMQEIVSDS
ncbi:PAX3- and PAX7-binding protein 1-like [Anneissia japonica]|uniref:PAX3- and PAX7-binding protein 1-like n=1 Tax=Anneissia japonica TaxID=1529436 RepID=UPI0014257658|nr:PAX3- and PAX7-binding protein 1-like [Anneissia japonica]